MNLSHNYIDIHTHTILNSGGIEVLNLTVQGLLESDPIDCNNAFSLGVHPWEVGVFNESEVITKISSVANPNFLFIGEIGLDKVKNDNYAQQEVIFEQLINLAKSLSKPLIIHSVKAHYDVISKLKNFQFPVIIHGYNGKIGPLKEFLKRGFYISISPNLLRNVLKAKNILELIPLDKLFIETDDTSLSIMELYKQVAEIKNITEEELVDICYQNFLRVIQ